MATIGAASWEMSRDEEGQREYKVTYKVVADSVSDGPFSVLNLSGLPVIGQAFSLGNDSDPWAFCTPYTRIKPVINRRQGEDYKYWTVEKKFSTIPITRCQDVTIDNPLAEPQKISGSFTEGERVTTIDKDGNAILNLAFEPVEVEDDISLPNVRIEQNVLSLGLDIFTPMMNTLNSVPMWGLVERTVKLSGASWERKYYGVCTAYYTRVFEFDINTNTFDRDDVPQRGKKVLKGAWDDSGNWVLEAGADIDDPRHYIRGVDRNGNYVEQFISASGGPSGTARYLPTVRIKTESNFFTLGVPASL